MVRAPYYDENGMKKGAWSAEEDEKLRTYVLRYGHWNWRQLPKFAGLERCGKSCRLRWVNYLQPQLERGNFTEEENALIIKLQQEIGNRWSTIAARLPGRTDNQIKNQWNAHLKKLVNKYDDQRKDDYCSILETSSSSHELISSGISDTEPTSVAALDVCLPSSDTLSITDFEIDDVSLPWSPTLYQDQIDPSGGDFWTHPFPFVQDNVYGNHVAYPPNILH